MGFKKRYQTLKESEQFEDAVDLVTMNIFFNTDKNKILTLDAETGELVNELGKTEMDALVKQAQQNQLEKKLLMKILIAVLHRPLSKRVLNGMSRPQR